MSSISYYKDQINTLNYQNGKNKELIKNLSENLLPLLNKSCEYMLYADKGIKEAYIIDGSSADKGSIKNNYDDINEIINEPKLKIIPGLNNKIIDNNKRITNYYSLIKSEQNRLEREAQMREEQIQRQIDDSEGSIVERVS